MPWAIIIIGWYFYQINIIVTIDEITCDRLDINMLYNIPVGYDSNTINYNLWSVTMAM